MTIFLASDHAGFELKEIIKKFLLTKNQYTVEDVGTFSNERVNWVEYGAKAAKKVSQNCNQARGILVCGSGIGMSIVSNKFKNIRAALCSDEYAAEMSRKHNNANILNLGGRVLNPETAIKIVEKWLTTGFEAGRHQQRLDYLVSNIEKINFK